MTTALRFRNIDASPDDPVETWPFEGILAAVERGTLPDWRRLAKAIQADPWGPVAQQVLEAVRLSRPYGTAELLEGMVARARKLAADSERVPLCCTCPSFWVSRWASPRLGSPTMSPTTGFALSTMNGSWVPGLQKTTAPGYAKRHDADGKSA